MDELFIFFFGALIGFIFAAVFAVGAAEDER